MSQAKRIVVVAKYNQAEALRVAAGLTLLSDTVQVTVLGRLTEDPAVQEQKEVLDFADVPCEELLPDSPDTPARLARAVLAADAVYLL